MSVGISGRTSSSAELRPPLDRAVAGARRGESDAAEDLLWYCRRIAERALTSEQVSDGAQMLAELAMSRLDPDRGAGACWTYLLAAARTGVRRALLRGSARPEPFEPPRVDELERRLDDARFTAMLPELVDRLPPKKQHAIRKYYFEGESISSIAGALGCPPSTIKARLHAARQQLRTMLALDERRDA